MMQSNGRRKDTEGVGHGDEPLAPEKKEEERPVGRSSGLVTVVIPCYNQAHFLGEAIESVLSQSYPNFEIVVVDDGSPDDTSEVASRYPRELVRLIRQKNQGLSGARNTGIRHARGEYVVFLDADDRLLPEALEVGVSELEAHPECAFVSGRFDNIAADGSPLKDPPRLHVEGDHYLALLRRCYIRPPAVVTFRRSVFEAVGGFDTSLKAAEDYEMYLRIARRFPVCNHKEVVAEYRRRHGANMSGDHTRMLSHSVGVLRSQRERVRGQKHYEGAYREGMRRRQWTHGDPLVEEVRAQLKEGEWGRALRGVLVLMRYYPQGLALLVLNERRMERRRRALRIQSSKQELEAHERHLEELEGGAREEISEGALAREHEELQQLRERIWRLERRTQNVDRGSQDGPDPRIRKSAKRVVGHLRARLRGR